MNALDRIAHDDKQSGPLRLGELSEGSENACVNPLLVRLPKPNHQNAKVLLVTVLGKTLVGGDKRPPISLRKRPKRIVENTLLLCSADI